MDTPKFVSACVCVRDCMRSSRRVCTAKIPSKSTAIWAAESVYFRRIKFDPNAVICLKSIYLLSQSESESIWLPEITVAESAWEWFSKQMGLYSHLSWEINRQNIKGFPRHFLFSIFECQVLEAPEKFQFQKQFHVVNDSRYSSSPKSIRHSLVSQFACKNYNLNNNNGISLCIVPIPRSQPFGIGWALWYYCA